MESAFYRFLIISVWHYCSTEIAPQFDGGTSLGNIDTNLINEASGLAASRRHKGVLYTLNDSGGQPRLFAISGVDAHLVAILNIEGATNCDWESLTVGPGPNGTGSYIYIGDTGGNSRRVCTVIYRVQEPEELVNATIPYQARVNYTWGEPDCETLLVDGGGRAYLVSKVPPEGTPKLYAVPRGAWSADRGQLAVTELTNGTDTSITRDPANLTTHWGRPVAGDISVDGRELLLKTYGRMLYWRLEEDELLADTLKRPGQRVPYRPEPQGETVAWHPEGSGYYTLSEQSRDLKPVPLWFYARVTGGSTSRPPTGGSTRPLPHLLQLFSLLSLIYIACSDHTGSDLL